MRSFESREDYLEAILVLQNEKGAVRSIDIAAKLGFTKPSVSRAMGLLRGAEYITVDRDGFNYYRFVTHMHYMMKRTLDDTMIDSQNRELFESMKKEYPDIYSCAVKVAALIDQKLQKHLSEEEILYLILHINRLCAREDCDR